jgi:integrase
MGGTHWSMEDVKRPSGLEKRGDVYEVRRRVPLDLVSYLGKGVVRRTLKTSNYKEACRLRDSVWVELTSEWDQKRREMLQAQAEQKTSIKLEEMKDSEIKNIAFSWLSEITRYSEEQELKNTSPIDSFDLEHNELETRMEEAELKEAVQKNDFQHVRSIASSLLRKQGISFDPKKQSYKLLCKFLNRAMLESLTRDRMKMEGKPVHDAIDPLFSSVGFTEAPANQNPSHLKQITLGALIEKYENIPEREHVSHQTKVSYRVIYRLLKEYFGEDTLVGSIDRDGCRDLRDKVIQKWPSNSAKKFPDKTIEETIQLAKKHKAPIVSITTMNNYLSNLSALMRFAKKERHTDYNPAEALTIKNPVKARDRRYPFTIDDLNKIFKAPIYTGCINDMNKYKHAGNAHPRRGRFWVPLISLWTGIRLNEICQLEVSDITQIDGVDVIVVHEESETLTNKSVKTEAGVRFVPIHPELKKIGFIRYAQKIRGVGSSRLFPELKQSGRGYYSDPFQKWFNEEEGFLDSIGVKRKKISFHSFRHGFRDALAESEVSEQVADALGGWKNELNKKSAGSSVYGHGFSAGKLHENISKIKYKELDLSHLYTK